MSIPRRETYEGLQGGWADGRLGQAHDLIWQVRQDHMDAPTVARLLSDLMDAVEAADEELDA